MRRAIRKKPPKKDSKWIEFVSAPIYQLSKEECKPAQMQNVLKKYSKQIRKHPFIVLRAFKRKKLKMAKGFEKIHLKVSQKSCEGKMSDGLTAQIDLNGTTTMRFDEYKTNALEKGKVTRQDIIDSAFGNKFEYYYAEHLDAPEKLIDMKTLPVQWNLRTENGLLNGDIYEGINTPNLYIGSPGSTFSQHDEDGDLISINFHLEGEPKEWFGVDRSEGPEMYKVLEPSDAAEDCKSFLRHKAHFINMNALKRNSITVYQHTQKPGDIIITKGFHQGGNHGFNLNIAVNAAIEGEDWSYSCIQEAEETSCDPDCKYAEKAVSLPNLAPRMVECVECKKKFDSDAGKKKHDRDVHKERRESQCKYCKQSVKKIIKHIKDVHLHLVPKVRCKLCLKLFPNVWDFNKHWKEKDQTKSGFRKCNNCEKSFRIKKHAMSHICVKK